MTKISKFGQYVKLTVKDDRGFTVFETDNLRIDFDIRNVSGWVRGKVSVYNLLPETFKEVTGDKNGNYITITTSLHDGDEEVLVDDLYISNALEEKHLPNSVSNFYCYSKLRRTFLEKQITTHITNPSLKNILKGIAYASDFKGEIKYKFFPKGYLDFVPPKPKSKQEGSVLSCLNSLSKQHKFKFFVEGKDLVLSYVVHKKNSSANELLTGKEEIVLSTDNMRSNPKIGPATLDIVSNLDPSIRPSTILDISKLITAGASVDEESLKVAEGLLREVVAGTRRYQAFTIQHKGSNFTKDWLTKANAIAPTSGFTMPIVSWFR